MTLKELRTKGRDQARGNIAILFIIDLVWGAIVSAVLVPAIIIFAVLLVLSSDMATGEITNFGLFFSGYAVFMILTFAITIIFAGMTMYGTVLNNNKMFKGEKATVEAGLEGLLKKKKISLKTFGLMTLYLCLWCLIPFAGFVIVIVKSYSYSCAFYIMQEDNSITGKEAISQSRKLMDGYKMKMFLLGLSYFGWYLLVTLTFGILAIWVTPWANQARYNLYQQIKGPDKAPAVQTA